jgi:hypothetical protein
MPWAPQTTPYASEENWYEVSGMSIRAVCEPLPGAGGALDEKKYLKQSSRQMPVRELRSTTPPGFSAVAEVKRTDALHTGRRFPRSFTAADTCTSEC